MPDYAVRISYSYDLVASLVSAWALRSKTMAVYEHTGSKTQKIHIHLVMTGTNVDKKQLRNIGNKFISLSGNELCSFKEFTGEESYMTYMTKGIHEPKYLLGYTREDHQRWLSKWVEPKQAVKVDKTEQLYLRFCDMNRGMEHFLDVKKNARDFITSWVSRCVTVQAINTYKMLVRTYCFENGISIPDGDKCSW